jgi:hypothetical protein
MAATYAKVTTYRDHGTCTLSPGSLSPTTVTFAIMFARPSRFRIELGILGQRVLVREHGGVIQHLHTINGKTTIERVPSVALAVARVTGISFGAAHTVPRMLRPQEVTGRMVCEEPDAVDQGMDDVDGVPCHRIEVGGGSIRSRLFIGAHDLLLHRVHDIAWPLRPMKASTLAGFLAVAHSEAEAASMRNVYERSQREDFTVTVNYAPEVELRLDDAVFAAD